MVFKQKKSFLIMFYPETEKIIDWIIPNDEIQLLEELKELNRSNTHLVVLLNSNGGLLHPGYKLAHILQSRCARLTMVVPHYAKSAATLIALGADEIVMGSQSELGPLDAQIEYPEGTWISALDAVHPLEQLFRTGSKVALDFGTDIRNKFGLERKESIKIGSEFASNYIKPLISKLDPRIVNSCFRLLATAQIYGEDLLVNHMFKREKNKEIRAEKISRKLVWEYTEHGFAIRKEEAIKIGLNIKDAKNLEQWDSLWRLYLKLRKENKKAISLLKKID